MSTQTPSTDFRIFVQKITMQGFYALGMIEVPGAPKQEEPNFEIAQAVIEDLEMLKQVTDGNLSEGERLTLDKYTADLKLVYVEKSSKKEGAAGGD
ncbi:MAG: DUF1844 domain-containing protein [Planctomycetes bacterium]|nr:DUF1844 domain-containing protein [Planctomycetota bacterium]MBL7007362.1 DUF1844 domain-containing protein [Planctomycetota bacterium]